MITDELKLLRVDVTNNKKHGKYPIICSNDRPAYSYSLGNRYLLTKNRVYFLSFNKNYVTKQPKYVSSASLPHHLQTALQSRTKASITGTVTDITSEATNNSAPRFVVAIHCRRDTPVMKAAYLRDCTSALSVIYVTVPSRRLIGPLN